MATSPINKTQPMREAEQDIADYLNGTVAPYMVTETQERKDADTTEASTRQKADETLQTNINAEASTRQKADETLQTNINTEAERAKAAESTNAQAILNEQQRATDALSEASAQLSAAIATEITERKQADNDVKNDLQASLNSEISARSDADSLLQGNIDLVNDKFPIKTDNIGAAQVTKAKLHESLQQQMTFLETVPSIEFGYINLGSIAAGKSITQQLTFSEAKTEAPFAFCTIVVNSDATGLTARVKYTTTTDAMFIINNGGTTSVSNATLDYLIISGR